MVWVLFELAVLLAAFGLLARLCPCNPGQPKFVSHELADDVLYWVLNTLFYGGLSVLVLKAGLAVVFQARAHDILASAMAGYAWARRTPLVAQAVMIIVVADVIQYWLHRLFHSRSLWPFHAIHHSAKDVTWTTTFRIHPLNFFFYTALTGALVRLLGFSPAAFVVIAPFNLVMGSVVHANLNWTYGPLRYVLASPVFHRWHHVSDPEIHDKNFASTFPVLDIVFGTFYMPVGTLPRNYGAEGVPEHFLGQLVHPFAVYATRLGLTRPAKPGPAAA